MSVDLSTCDITAEFVTGVRGRIFVLARHPQSFDGRCLLVVPPFAEEMNKSRKMIAELAKQVATRGKGVIVPDFFGTGDSEGDFSETDCVTWQADLAAVESWAKAKGWIVDSLLGIRLGGPVAAEYAQSRAAPTVSTMLWQPVLDGSRSLDQFLRLRVAASLMNDRKETVAELKAQFAAGNVVDVAGYGLSPLLAEQMAKLNLLANANAKLGAMHWFEVLRSAEATVAMPTTKAIDRLQAEQLNVTLHTVVGEPFWTSTEIVCVPDLLSATAQALLAEAA